MFPLGLLQCHSLTKATWISGYVGPRLKNLTCVKAVISNKCEWINFSCALVQCVLVRMGSVSAVTTTSPKFQELTHRSLYLNHTTCIEWMDMDFWTISVSGTQDDREVVIWNILGSCKRKSLQNHIGAVHCLIAGSLTVSRALESTIYILKIVIQCAGFISNTFILKF